MALFIMYHKNVNDELLTSQARERSRYLERCKKWRVRKFLFLVPYIEQRCPQQNQALETPFSICRQAIKSPAISDVHLNCLNFCASCFEKKSLTRVIQLESALKEQNGCYAGACLSNPPCFTGLARFHEKSKCAKNIFYCSCRSRSSEIRESVSRIQLTGCLLMYMQL